jgi:hypothetical protein
VHIASYWMAHGVEMENIAERLKDQLLANSELTVMIAVIDPTASYIPLLADYLDLDEEALISRVRASLTSLDRARSDLPMSEQARLSVRVYATVPSASFVLLDVAEPNGRIQMDFKPYKVPRQSSITFEFRGQDRTMYRTLKTAALKLLQDCPLFDPAVHLTSATSHPWGSHVDASVVQLHSTLQHGLSFLLHPLRPPRFSAAAVDQCGRPSR